MMKNLIILLFLQSCSLLLSPEVLPLEEELVEDVVKEVMEEPHVINAK